MSYDRKLGKKIKDEIASMTCEGCKQSLHPGILISGDEILKCKDCGVYASDYEAAEVLVRKTDLSVMISMRHRSVNGPMMFRRVLMYTLPIQKGIKFRVVSKPGKEDGVCIERRSGEEIEWTITKKIE